MIMHPDNFFANKTEEIELIEKVTGEKFKEVPEVIPRTENESLLKTIFKNTGKDTLYSLSAITNMLLSDEQGIYNPITNTAYYTDSANIFKILYSQVHMLSHAFIATQSDTYKENVSQLLKSMKNRTATLKQTEKTILIHAQNEGIAHYITLQAFKEYTKEKQDAPEYFYGRFQRKELFSGELKLQSPSEAYVFEELRQLIKKSENGLSNYAHKKNIIKAIPKLRQSIRKDTKFGYHLMKAREVINKGDVKATIEQAINNPLTNYASAIELSYTADHVEFKKKFEGKHKQ